MEFGTDRQAIKFIQGTISGACRLQCQRCMEPVELPIQQQFQLALIRTDEDAEHLPQQYEPMLLGETISIVELVEEEILLALPLVPMHAPDQCSVKVEAAELAEAKNTDSSNGAKQNPFGVLKKLIVE